MTRIITITSGKPGVGKTTIAVNLAKQLAALGKRVCLLDADPGENDVAVQLGIKPNACLDALLAGNADLDEICQGCDEGFDWLSIGAHLDSLTQLLPGQVQRLVDAVACLSSYDFILIDAASSLNANLLGLSLASSDLLLVIGTDAESLSESYALLKVLFSEAYSGTVNVLVNKTKNHTVGRHSYNKFKEVAGFYLDMDLSLAGMIADDPLVAESQTVSPSPGFSDIEALAHRLMNASPAGEMTVAEFSDRYLRATGQPANDGLDDVAPAPAWRRAEEEPASLYNQLEQLSGQVDTLIAEINTLRQNEPVANTELLALQTPPTKTETETEQCAEACIAAMASFTETCNRHGDRFSIYQINQSDGRLQRFAFHSLDDDIQEPEPQTKSS